MTWYFWVPVGISVAVSFVWAISKNFLTTKVKRLEKEDELHVVIAGGSEGIGFALAKRAALEGAHVTIMARREGPLKEAEKALKAIADSNAMGRGRGQNILAISADMCDPANVGEAMVEGEAKNGPVDVLICNVGTSSQAPFEQVPIVWIGEDYERLMRVNYLSAVYACKAVVQGMKERRKGRIVLMSSQAGQIGLYGYTAYSPAKFAIRGFAEALQLEQMELTPYDVRVTVAFPPNTDTKGFKKEVLEMPEELKIISDTGKTWDPCDVAAVVWNDAMEGSHYSTMGLDGWMLGRSSVTCAPETSPENAVQQVFLNGLLRLISLGYLQYFDQVVEKCRQDRLKTK